MTASAWACAALLSWHLGFTGALPREVPVDRVRAYAAGQRDIRVLIFKDARTLTLRPTRTAALEDAESQARLATIAAGASLRLAPSGGRVRVQGAGVRTARPRIRLRPLTEDGSTLISGRGGWGRRATYPGVLDISLTSRGLRVVEHLDLESYVAGVLTAEMPAYFPLEAMKAQAVAARTYALHHLGAHAPDGADICARVHCQAYAGGAANASTAARAAQETAGQVLSWNGLLVDAVYHSACGGSTAPAWEVRQGKLLPYLRGVQDAPPHSPFAQPYCARDHDVAWTRRLSRAAAENLVSSNLAHVLGERGLAPGRLKSLQAIPNSRGDRIAWLQVLTEKGTYRVRGDAVRWLFGTGYPAPGGLRSTAFDLTMARDARGQPTAFIFQGVGHGHGLGLCQWGARGRALAGQTAAEILAAYYPGATVTDLRL